MRTDIVVGFDGSTGATSAVDWAAHEADLRGVGLRVVTAEPWVPLSYGAPFAGAVPPRGNHRADEIVAGGRRQAASVLDASRLESLVIPGYAPVALVRESGDAVLVVVGHRAHSRARECATGSVALAVATHSRCDVVVVPPGDTVLVGPGLPVVVAVDGSDASDRVARRAAHIAAERGASLVVVRTGGGRTGGGRTGGGRRPERPGPAAGPDALTEASRGAGLVVVGSHGLRAFGRAVLDSADRAALRRAGVPVLVVRG